MSFCYHFCKGVRHLCKSLLSPIYALVHQYCGDAITMHMPFHKNQKVTGFVSVDIVFVHAVQNWKAG